MSGKPETGAASATHEDRTRVGERSETANQRTEVREENQSEDGEGTIKAIIKCRLKTL